MIQLIAYGVIAISIVLAGYFMLSLLNKQNVDLSELLAQNAQIIDVRSAEEFAGGHDQRSINIPLAELKSRMNEIKKDVPIIVVCLSGGRSQMAMHQLKDLGLENVYNGGGWHVLSKYE